MTQIAPDFGHGWSPLFLIHNGILEVILAWLSGMVRRGLIGFVISGLEKQAWTRCKATLQVFYPNWGRKEWDYGGWFTWSSFRQGVDIVQAILDWIYGPKDGIPFLGISV